MSNVLSPHYEYLKGKDAWRSNLRLTAYAADRIKSSFGPNGAYKMVTYNRGPEIVAKVTKDAVAVLQELAIQYPTLVVLSEAAKLQRQEQGDGVKTFIMLAAGLLKEADDLIAKGVHPAVILAGYQRAASKAIQIIDACAQTIPAEKLAGILDSVDCGRGCLTPKLRTMILEAAKLDKERIRFVRKPGCSQTETTLVKGIIIKKAKVHPNLADAVDNPRIALTSEHIGTNRIEIKMPSQGPFHMKFNISSPENLAGCKKAENQHKSDALCKLGEFGVSTFFCQQPIDAFSKAKLSAMGVLAFESVDPADLALISKATGAKIVGPLAGLEAADVGFAEKIETDKIGLEKTVTLTGCDFATFLIRGSSLQALEELELLIENGLKLVRTAKGSGKALAGGGAAEMWVARELKTFALQFPGKEQLAVDSFSEALLELPRCLAENCGVNSDEALAQLSRLHADGFSGYGVCSDGSVGESCFEVLEAKRSAVWRAFEVASLMLRVDEQVRAKEISKFHKQ